MMDLPVASLPERYAAAFKILALCMLTAPALPTAPFIACGSLIISYWSDKASWAHLTLSLSVVKI
jgi:hypothetical protein